MATQNPMDGWPFTPAAQPRILVVDDEITTRAAITRALTLTGYRADSVASGKQALAKLAGGSYDLMLLDLRMPEMDGSEVMQRAWQLDPDLLIIILTAYATLDSAITAVKGGAADYLLKPCSLHDIQDSIARALRQRGEILRQQRTVRQISDAIQSLHTVPQAKAPGPSPDATERYLRRGTVTLDRAARQAILHRSGHDNGHDMHVELTAHQVAVLNCLMEHADTAVSCRDLVLAALGTSVHESDAENIIRPHISRLRKKIEPDPAHPTVIRTVRGAGYQFASE